MKITVALLCTFTFAPARALPPPPAQFTADCLNPSYASDFLICADEELLALDQALLRRIKARNNPLTEETETDEAWFKRSRLCAFDEDHRTCLLKAFCERFKVLDDAASRSISDERYQP